MKTMKKILSLVLVCVMLVGAISAFGVTASAEDQTIAIVAKNVYYGETLQLMYAVDAPVLNAGDEVKVTLYADEACTLKFCDAYEDGTTTVNGVKCSKFYASKGVPAQDMNLVVYAKAEIVNNGTTVASTVFAYSVLQYFNELYYKTTNEDLKALATSIVAYAKAAEAVVYNTADKQANRVSQPVANNNYVAVDANVLGVAQGMYVANSTPFANVATDLVAGEGEAIAWTVTDLDTGLATVYDLDSLKALTLTANVKVSVAVVEGTVEPEPTPVILTIPEALALADDTAVIVSGTVCQINTAYNSSYDNITVTITDGEGNNLMLYRVTGNWEIGDILVVTGTMTTYNEARQTAQGATAEKIGTCAHENASEATCKAEGTCAVCGAVVAEKTDHADTNSDGSCDTCGQSMGATVTTTKLDFSTLAAGTQYADESNTFDNNVVVSTHNKGCHFNTQLRIYDSASNNGWAIINTGVAVDSLVINMGYKKATLNVYGSKDGGVTWDLIEAVATTATTYNDYSVSVGAANGYTQIKIDASGAQIRVASITVTTIG